MYKIGELSKIVNVKAGTIRFYEKCGFLEPVDRLPNRYRIYNEHHIYQIRICRLVFGGFVSKSLRKTSLKILEASRAWDLIAYENRVLEYLQEIQEDIKRTEKVITFAVDTGKLNEESHALYTKKQAATLVGTTQEAIRNWERNGLIPQSQPYQKRYYSQATLNRMYLIRLLLNTGYSLMAILQFLQKMDSGEHTNAKAVLTKPEESEDLQTRADYYLQALLELQDKANALYELLNEMKKI